MDRQQQQQQQQPPLGYGRAVPIYPGQHPPAPPPYAFSGGQGQGSSGSPPGPYLVHSPYAYSSPPNSCGTPHFPRASGSSHEGGRKGSWKNQQSLLQHTKHEGGGGGAPVDRSNVVLVPTRPLLKALAKNCKPNPPWGVGSTKGLSLGEELQNFASFVRPTPTESAQFAHLMAVVGEISKELWPAAELKPMGLNATGIFPVKDSTYNVYPFSDSPLPDTSSDKLREIANGKGFQVDFFVDYRELPVALLSEARSGEKVAIHYGPNASALIRPNAEELRKAFFSQESRLIALIVIESLLRQNKVLDEHGANPSGLSPEAAAVMLLAIINSYSSDDVPDARRLLVDFFLTYGFAAHFDHATTSVSAAGMTPPTPKVHKDAQLSVVESGSTRNLAGKCTKVAHILAVFNYCFTALSQFEQVPVSERRAQSALSTILGGEAYWSRVLTLYREGIQPYAAVVQSYHDVLAAEIQGL